MYKKIIVFATVLLVSAAITYLCTRDKNPINVEEVKTDEKFENVIYDKAESLEQTDILGTITIEKIGLSASVKEGSEAEILKEYVGHIEDTAIYDGNVCLAAHNRGNQYSYFARLNELQEGDIVQYKTKYGDRNYSIFNKDIITETDWTLLDNSSENLITMITCIANRPTQRLCVQAREI